MANPVGPLDFQALKQTNGGGLQMYSVTVNGHSYTVATNQNVKDPQFQDQIKKMAAIFEKAEGQLEALKKTKDGLEAKLKNETEFKTADQINDTTLAKAIERAENIFKRTVALANPEDFFPHEWFDEDSYKPMPIAPPPPSYYSAIPADAHPMEKPEGYGETPTGSKFGTGLGIAASAIALAEAASGPNKEKRGLLSGDQHGDSFLLNALVIHHLGGPSIFTLMAKATVAVGSLAVRGLVAAASFAGHLVTGAFNILGGIIR